MSANAPTQKISLAQDLECPVFSVAHIFSLLDDRLTEDARVEVQLHISRCRPCEALEDEIKLMFKTQHKRPTRSEQLLYLKNVLSPLGTLLDEPAYKFDKKFRSKTNRRLSELERAVKQKPVALDVSNSNPKNPLILHKFEASFLHKLFTELKGIEGLEYPLTSNLALECPLFDVHHFVALFRAELTKDEGLELIEHLPECLACSSVYKEVYTIWEHEDKVTRVEQLNYLRNCFGGLSTIQGETRRKFVKRCISKSERKLKRHFQDELSCTVQGALLAFIETNKTEILANVIAPLQEQVKDLQAQVDLLLAQKQEVSSNAIS